MTIREVKMFEFTCDICGEEAELTTTRYHGLDWFQPDDLPDGWAWHTVTGGGHYDAVRRSYLYCPDCVTNEEADRD